MRVTIEHRETISGTLQKHKDCFVDCTVQFNEEEKAIIHERDLYREGFSVRASTPLPSKSSFVRTALARIFGLLMAVGGFFGAVIEGLGNTHTNFGHPIFLAGIGLMIFGFIRSREEKRRLENPDQEITIKQLLANPTFTVHAWNAAYAKPIEDEIREHLSSLKNRLLNAAELGTKKTFEL